MANNEIKKKRGRPKKCDALPPLEAEIISGKKVCAREALPKEEQHVAMDHYMARVGFDLGNVAPSDIGNITRTNLQLYLLPPVDIKSAEGVQGRIVDFFKVYADNDMKPTVAGLAMALGLDRLKLQDIVSGAYNAVRTGATRIPDDVVELIRDTYRFMETMWESYMTSGKLNPVAGIFLATNNFNYRNRVDNVLIPTAEEHKELDAAEIAKRYLPEGGNSDE